MANVIPLGGKSASGPASGLNSVEEIVADLKAGRMVIIIDDEDRENEGDLIMAADGCRGGCQAMDPRRYRRLYSV